MEDDIKSESTLGDEWVRESSSPWSLNREAGVPTVATAPSLESEMEHLVVEKSSASSAVLSDAQAEIYRRNWMTYLGTQNKPGVPREIVSTCGGKATGNLRKQCEALVAGAGDSNISADDLEAILRLFCEREECSFDEQWFSVLEMLIPLHCFIDQLYNLFYAVITKFLPRNTTRGAICYQLMRLVLQYHDPVLSTHLESLKIAPYDFAYPCFSTLFASEINKQSLYVIWDKYFEKGDPFMLFAMVLVFLINLSEELIEIESKEEVLRLFRSATTELSTEDVNDFFILSVHFLNQTPPSIKQDFQRALFGSQSAGRLTADVDRLLALPIDPRDLIRLNADENRNIAELNFNFFIIDARPHEQYAAGHLDGSYNLDSSLFVESPERYKLALSSLDAFRCASRQDDHLLFVGSGREEDDLYVHMVIANFLHDGRKHVAVLDGGYRALHSQLLPNLDRLDGHCVQLCKECVNLSPALSVQTRRKSSWKTGVGSVLNAVKAAAPAIGEKMRFIAQLPTVAVRTTEKGITHVDASQRHCKRYRNERSVFTLSDTDSETEDSAFCSASTNIQPKKLNDILSQNDILDHFEGVEVLLDGTNWRTIGCHLALTRTHIHVFHQRDEDDKVVVRSRHAYGSVLRVSSKKKVPEMLTFKFGYSTGENEYKVTAVQRFVLPQAGECAKAIKMNIVNLRPGIMDC